MHQQQSPRPRGNPAVGCLVLMFGAVVSTALVFGVVYAGWLFLRDVFSPLF